MAVTRNDPQKPWWADGCCHKRGDIGFVYVNYSERRVLAKQLGLSVRAFTREYTVSEDDGARVLKFSDNRCIFLEDAACKVHEAKPTQCRTWPFWRETLASKEAYKNEVLDFCLGSHKGKKVCAEEIRRQMDETEQALWEV